MSIRVKATQCGMPIKACVDSDSKNWWLYDQLFIVDSLVISVQRNLHDVITIVDDYEAELSPRPVDSLFINDVYASVAQFYRTFLEEIDITDVLSIHIEKPLNDGVLVDDEIIKNGIKSIGLFDYALGSIEMGSREIHPIPDGREDDELLITDDFQMILM